MKLFNSLNQKFLRQELRKNTTPQEAILWSRLRKRQVGGYKFVRQYGIGDYIVDFYCPAKRLVVEVDGAQHGKEDAVLYDQERTAYFESLNLRVLRFWNNEITTNLDPVCETLLQELEAA